MNLMDSWQVDRDFREVTDFGHFVTDLPRLDCPKGQLAPGLWGFSPQASKAYVLQATRRSPEMTPGQGSYPLARRQESSCF